MPQATKRRERPLVAPSAVRRWAKQQGIDVGVRGRVSADVIQRYRRAKRIAA